MRETPYSPEEQRVSDYIQEITQGMIGSGEDPIGFLIASHRMFSHVVKTTFTDGMFRRFWKDSLSEADSSQSKA